MEIVALAMEFADQIAGYRILTVLGYGASSTIYAVQSPTDGQVYALKRVVKRTPSDQRFIDQALTEHNTASQLHHPALRKSFKVIRKRQFLRVSEVMILMELVDGLTLEQHRPESIFEMVRTFIAVADGLSVMHKVNLVHADIKPKNILLTGKEQVKIIDFGQSCPIGTVKTRIQGTPDYIAPEQVKRGVLTPRTDVFNFGATMYWCLTNAHVPTLIPKPNSPVSKAPKPTPPSELNPAIPGALNTLILHCVQERPDERPESMTEINGRLEMVLKQLEREQTPPTTPPDPSADSASDSTGPVLGL